MIIANFIRGVLTTLIEKLIVITEESNLYNYKLKDKLFLFQKTDDSQCLNSRLFEFRALPQTFKSHNEPRNHRVLSNIVIRYQ